MKRLVLFQVSAMRFLGKVLVLGHSEAFAIE